MKSKVPLLYIDIEGGWGGSSRSLYYLVKNLDRNRYMPIVVYGKEGPNKRRYSEINIPAYLFTPIPRMTAIRRNYLKAIAAFLLKLWHLPRFLFFVKKLIEKYKIRVIHLNHESLFFVAIFFKVFFNCKRIYHVRTMLPKNIFGKIQIWLASSTADHLFFITENEQELWHCTSSKTRNIPQSVVYNFYEAPKEFPKVDILRKYRDKFKLAILNSISYYRGTDRLLDISMALRRRNCNQVVFVVYGRVDNRDPYTKSFMREIKTKQLEKYFIFVGYQKFPESILTECDALFHSCRMIDNPWGRDIIEAMMNGKPVIAVGTYNKFIEDGINGYLVPTFDVEEIADKITCLLTYPEIGQKMGMANKEKAALLFRPFSNIAKITRIYDHLAAA